MNRIGLIFRALHYRNYRLFFTGQCISLIGTWMQQIAVGWLVYRLTQSPFLLGVVGFAGMFPTFIFAPFAGVLSDRWNRLWILLLTQTLSMLQALILAVLVLTEVIAVWHIILLSLILGCVNAVDIPTRQSFVIHMIDDRRDLGNAIALNSAMFNATRFLGPSIAGILIALTGEGICFLVNGISYLAAIAALLALNIVHIPRANKGAKIFHDLREGFIYAYNMEPIRLTLLVMAITSIIGIPFMVLMPAYARDILHGGPHTLGFLMSASGAGALAGALYLASQTSSKGLMKKIPLATGIFGIGLTGVSLVHIMSLSIILLFIAGFGMMVLVASGNTLLQTIVEDDKRGRIMSFFAVSFMGMAPFGSLLAGILANLAGLTFTMLIGGVGCSTVSVICARKFFTLDTNAPKTNS
jgi:MFS family permease